MDNSVFELSLETLDKAWLDQPKLYMEALDEASRAKSKLEWAKYELEVVESNIAQDVRANPKTYGIDKISEAAVKEAVTRDGSVRSWKEKVAEAKFAVTEADNVVSALDMRRRALENLVQLHGQQYFSEPRDRTGSGIGKAAKEQARQETRRHVSDRLNKKGAEDGNKAG